MMNKASHLDVRTVLGRAGAMLVLLMALALVPATVTKAREAMSSFADLAERLSPAVEIFTTAGISRFDKSRKLAGRSLWSRPSTERDRLCCAAAGAASGTETRRARAARAGKRMGLRLPLRAE